MKPERTIVVMTLVGILALNAGAINCPVGSKACGWGERIVSLSPWGIALCDKCVP